MGRAPRRSVGGGKGERCSRLCWDGSSGCDSQDHRHPNIRDNDHRGHLLLKGGVSKLIDYGLHKTRALVLAVAQPLQELGNRHTAFVVVALVAYDDAVVLKRPALPPWSNVVLGRMTRRIHLHRF